MNGGRLLLLGVISSTLLACGGDSEEPRADGAQTTIDGAGGGTIDGNAGPAVDGAAAAGPDAAAGTQPDAGPPGCTQVPGTPQLGLQLVAQGFSLPTYATSPPGDARIFVTEKNGDIWIVDGGTVLATPFLSLTVTGNGSLGTDDEQGLLGLAFHPGYAQNRKFYVFTTDNDYGGDGGADIHVHEYLTMAADPNRADPNSGQEVFFVEDDYSNHNGGMLAFGPNDGYLYIGVGDGGWFNGPEERARYTTNPHGKIHRIDVASLPATAPASNPFVGTPGAVQTIWAYGLRNPWRFSFDRETGDLYIGDVGQDVWEEIDVQPASSSGGEDYGWDEWEANVCFENDTGCPMAGHTFPVYDYSHNDGCSVTGGYVYRGCAMPGYHGTYFFADYCNGWVRSFEWNGAGGVTNEIEWLDLSGGNPSSFGEDANGELLLVRHNNGRVYRIVPQ